MNQNDKNKPAPVIDLAAFRNQDGFRKDAVPDKKKLMEVIEEQLSKHEDGLMHLGGVAFAASEKADRANAIVDGLSIMQENLLATVMALRYALLDKKILTEEEIQAGLDKAFAFIQVQKEQKVDQQTGVTNKAQGGVVETGDVAVINILGLIDGKPFPGGLAQFLRVTIGSNSFIPGFEDNLIGLKVTETKKFDLTFPADYGNPELAGKAATFEVVVLAIKTSIPQKTEQTPAKE